ncbi:MAG: protein kinase [Gemmatimonadaceae bacterium]|nr:protein kinase [Gemmatimonadaceae bacterium]
MTDPSLLADALADRYRLLGPLGQGGMATVYLAHDHKHGREVAIKVLRPELAKSLGRERFLREIQLAARLSHPHILPLYDSGEAAGVLYFVMPVMQGQTLRERLVAGVPLPVEEAVRVATEVADALDYAHRHDIVHRDIKPENILLHEGHAIVADFGIGKAIAAATVHDAAVTQIGVTVGTPAYLSPEQAAGDSLDGRSDLFALGCVLYEMLTGEVAFTGANTPAVIGKRFTYTPPPVTSSRADIPAGVAATTTRLLCQSPDDRFASGAEVVAALRAMRSSSSSSNGHARHPRSIAVLPFANLSSDAENEFFSDGLTEEIITDLSGVKALRVTSGVSARQLKGTTKGVREIGRLLGVRYALTGSVRRAGNALRVAAQLVDTDTDEQLWGEKFSGTMEDVFDVQERVSRAIVGALRVTLSAGEDARLAERPIRDARAYELYLKAQELVRRYGAPIERVLALLDRADEIEGPSLPLRALRTYTQIMQMRAGMTTDAGDLVRAESEARALLVEAPDAAYGHALLGYIAYERGDLAGAVRGLTRALECDPSDADARFFLGISLEAAGQHEASFTTAKRFLELDPLSSMAALMLCSTYWFVGLPGKGLDVLENAVTLDPENPIMRWTLGYTHALLGHQDVAREHATWMEAHVPQMPYTAHLTALVHAMDGRAADAVARLRAIEAMQFDGHLTFHISEPYALAGEHEVALRLLADAVERGFYPGDFIASHCPFLEPLRGLPEFPPIAARAAQRVAEFRA